MAVFENIRQIINEGGSAVKKNALYAKKECLSLQFPLFARSSTAHF